METPGQEQARAESEVAVQVAARVAQEQARLERLAEQRRLMEKQAQRAARAAREQEKQIARARAESQRLESQAREAQYMAAAQVELRKVLASAQRQALLTVTAQQHLLGGGGATAGRLPPAPPGRSSRSSQHLPSLRPPPAPHAAGSTAPPRAAAETHTLLGRSGCRTLGTATQSPWPIIHGGLRPLRAGPRAAPPQPPPQPRSKLWQLTQAGMEEWQARKYSRAARCYTEAIAACEAEGVPATQQAMLYVNRAACRLRLMGERPRALALRDAERARRLAGGHPS
eukprot:COSAG01_NODE_15456_length_1336_cov_1.323363_2_plen_284_part_01